MHRSKYFIYKTAVPICLTFTTVSALGEPHLHPHHDAEEIIITADPLGDIDSNFAAPVTVITKEALRKETMRSIGETVANQPGVTSSDFGASVGRPVIRGQSGGRVRVLEDGIGTLDISTISGDHGVSTESIFAEQVEILRGPATLLYGSGASGGLVNVVNGRILSALPERIMGDAYVHYDIASDGWLTAVQADAPIGNQLALHLDGLKRSSDDVDIPGFAATMPEIGARKGVLANSDSEAHNYSAGLSWILDDGFLGFNISRLENEYGVPGVGHGHDDEDPAMPAGVAEPEQEAEGGTSIDLRQTRYDIKAAYYFDHAVFDRVKARFAYNDYEHDEIEGSGEIGTQFTNNELEGRIEVVHLPFGQWHGVVGLQVRDKDFSAVGEEAFVPPSEVSNISVFLFEKADFNRVHVDAGIRYENQDAESSLALKGSSHNLLSVSAGASFEYLDGYEIGLNMSRTQRAPTIEELFANGPHLATNTFEIGSVNLGQETSHNLDVFWRGTLGRATFDLTVFYNDISDYVFLNSNDRNRDGVADRVEDDFLETGEIVDEQDALLLVSQLQQDARFWGFEFITDMQLFNSSRGELNARLWSDYVAGELDSQGDVPRLPPLRLGFNLDWEQQRFYAGGGLKYVISQQDTARLETETDGYTMVNLHAGYRIPIGPERTLTVFARGTNLANETARRHTSFVKELAPLPGRSGMFGLRLDF